MAPVLFPFLLVLIIMKLKVSYGMSQLRISAGVKILTANGKNLRSQSKSREKKVDKFKAMIGVFVLVFPVWIIILDRTMQEQTDRQYKLDIERYNNELDMTVELVRQTALQDSMLVYQKAIYNDTRTVK